MSGLDEVARSWLRDPAWQLVFKHTFDVIEDYVSYVLITVGAISLSVRLLTTLGTGDLTCVLIGVQNGTAGQLLPYGTGGSIGFINYASTDDICIRAVLSPVMEYLPYLILLQTLILVIVEKFSLKIPRIAQKVERFYKIIVEDSLFGKDPDVTEDMSDPKTSTEFISRRRQRNEICVTLKRSQIIMKVYVLKNIAEIILVIVFLTVNISYTTLVDDSKSKACHIRVHEFPELDLKEGTVHFQCRGKKMPFFLLMLSIQCILLFIHGLCSVGTLVWCFGFRSVSRLLSKMILNANYERKEGHSVPYHHSDFLLNRDCDFLFLFDLLSHSCGLESTLRVLTHSDDTFYEICKPSVDVIQDLSLEEDKLKVIWRPADIERWLCSGLTHRGISVDSYEVTIFPAETINHTTTRKANLDFINNDQEAVYSSWFYDLQGGRTEYVITIACIIGKSRMKGEKVITNLVPYGPEVPRTGMVKSVGTHQVELFWDPPKGEFTKYTLQVEEIIQDWYKPLSSDELATINSPPNLVALPSRIDSMDGLDSVIPPIRKMEDLSHKLTQYTLLGLEPGSIYKAELGTKTGNVQSRQSISEFILTRPAIPQGAMLGDITSSSCNVQWLIPDGHPCLRGFQIKALRHRDNVVIKNIAVKKSERSFTLIGLGSGTDYIIQLISLCGHSNRKTESESVELNLVTPPNPPINLRSDGSSTSSITVQWDPPVSESYTTLKYKLTIESEKLKYYYETEIDTNVYNFSKLPEILGTGEEYKISIMSQILSLRTNQMIPSRPLVDHFYTKPLPPSNFAVRPLEQGFGLCSFTKSKTNTVTKYKIRYRAVAKEGSSSSSSNKSNEIILPTNERNQEKEEEDAILFQFPDPIEIGVIYKINIYSLVDVPSRNILLESKELHEEIILNQSHEQITIYKAIASSGAAVAAGFPNKSSIPIKQTTTTITSSETE